jgi:N-carbamoylputrescine amidase
MEDLRVAAVTMRSRVGEPAENLDRMEGFLGRAAREGARAVCFPEMNISGYGLRQSFTSLAEPIPGPSSDAVVRMARSHRLLILAGLAEKAEGGGVFISHFAASPEGLLGVYRKIHLGPPEEGLYVAGTEAPVFQLGRTTFGMELCFDGHFPELSTVLALKGAEVFFIPHASPRESPGEKQGRWLRYLGARAYDNSAFLVACNQVGPTESGLNFPGAALILTPRGEVLASGAGEGEGMIFADLREEALRETRESQRGFFLGRRRPELYRELIRQTINS